MFEIGEGAGMPYAPRQEPGKEALCKTVKQRDRTYGKNNLKHKPVSSKAASPCSWVTIWGSKQNALASVYRLIQVNIPEKSKEVGVKPGTYVLRERSKTAPKKLWGG